MPRILVADDNSNIQKMVALAFEEHGIDVVAVGNGEAAVRRIPDLNPDVVLADVFMPVRNGYEVCEFVKKDPRFAKVPVILLVGAFDPLDEQEARRVGADGVLKKPFVPPDPLIAMVTSALEKAPKPEVKAAPEPVAEIPRSAPPPPPPPPDAFPEPTPEEEAFMFGTGRRSLDEDDKVEAAAPLSATPSSAPAATHAEIESAAATDDDLTFSGTRSDWRRQKEVDFAAVPSFSAELVDAPAEARLEPSASRELTAFAESRAESTLADPNPFAALSEAETKIESVVATAITLNAATAPVIESAPEETRAEVREEVEARTVVPSPAVIEPAAYVESPAVEQTVAAVESRTVIEEAPAEFHAAFEPVTAQAPVVNEAPVVEVAQPEPVVEARIETPATPAEPVVQAAVEPPPAVVEAPVAPGAKVEPVVEHAAPAAPESTLSSVVETVTSPRKWLDFLLPSRAPRVAEPATPPPSASAPPVTVPEELPGAATPVAQAPAEVAPAAEVSPSAETQSLEPAVSAVSAFSAAPPAEVAEPSFAAVSESAAPAAESHEAVAEPQSVDSGQHWSEIASQLAAEAPLVEAAQNALQAEPVAESPAPLFASPAVEEPSPTPEAPSAHAVEAAPSAGSLADVVERAASLPSQAPPEPVNVDEVVAKIIEKLGPQIQDLLAKGVVKPLVEDMLKKK